MRREISFLLDGSIHSIDFSPATGLSPTTTVLQYLRSLPGHKGVKEGCAEGDCGACTVVVGTVTADRRLTYRAVDSCLLFLPMLHGKHLVTVENLQKEDGHLHPVQQAMVNHYGSQCGFCTPGIVMSLFAFNTSGKQATRDEVEEALSGNLCRCTGYRPIVDAALEASRSGASGDDSDDGARIGALLGTIPSESVRIETAGQQYLRPVSMGEAVSLLHRSPDAIIVGGATDVALRVTKGHERLTPIIDLSGICELAEITETEAGLTIGAGATLNEVKHLAGDRFPALRDVLSVFGSKQIRNLATLGGNIGTASPIGDTIPVLIAYKARVVLESLNGIREFALDDYITGYRRTLRKPDELVRSIILPAPGREAIVKVYKVSRRRDLDIATVSGGFRIEKDSNGLVRAAILAYGGMAPKVTRAEATERYITGKLWGRSTIEQAMNLLSGEFSPISDVRGSAEMRRLVSRNLLLKFWHETSGGKE